MPIYEYHCEPCDHTFETLDPQPGRHGPLPAMRHIDLTKQFSVPAAAQTGRGAGPSLPVCEPGGGGGFGCGAGPCGSGMCSME